MGKKILFGILGFLVGFATVFAGFMLTEVICGFFHPVPPEAQQSMEAMAAIVRTYPGWVLGLVVGLWGLTVMAAAWVGTRIGGGIAGLILCIVVLALFYCNLWQFPYPLWFEAAEIVSLPICLLIGRQMVMARQTDPAPSVNSAPKT